MKPSTFLSLVFVLLFVSSCQKEESIISFDNEEYPKLDAPNVIFTFKNMEEYSETLKKITKMTKGERALYEASNGYKSFGRLCDEFYENIDPEEFRSIEEIKTFVTLNSEYIQMIDEKNGDFRVEVSFYDNPNRYLIDETKLFVINNSVYKVYDNLLLSTNIENITELNSFEEKSISECTNNQKLHFNYLDSEMHNESKDWVTPPTYFCGDYFHDSVIDDRDRTDVTLGWKKLWQLNYWFYTTYFELRPYKKTLGVWFRTSRTCSWDVRWASDFKAQGFDWERTQHYVYGSRFDNEIYEEESIFYTLEYSTNEIHFGGYDGWGRTLSTPFLYFHCTPFVLEY